jgi:predicted nucleotidyltransferase
MNYTGDSITSEWSIEGVYDRLKQNEEVEGLLLIGSLAKNELSPASDYDLVIVLRNSQLSWYVGVTTINNRFTDLLFVNEEAITAIQNLTSVLPFSHELAPIIRWLKNGVILYDRMGKLTRAQRKVQQGKWISSISDEDAYGAWFALCYNLAVTKRMMSADDDFYHAAAGIRMAVYGHMDLWFGYFKMRKMEWAGDKATLTYLRLNDTHFLEAYQKFITSIPLEQKILLYEQAANFAAAPFGGVWPSNITVMNDAQNFKKWEELLGE